MDEIRLKDELIARLSGEMGRETLQLVEAALLVVLRNYDVKKKETQLSTEVVTWPEYDIFISRLKFSGYSRSTITQYSAFIKNLLVYVGKPVDEITGDDIVACLNAYAAARQISDSTKDHKRLICSSFFSFLHDRGYSLTKSLENDSSLYMWTKNSTFSGPSSGKAPSTINPVTLLSAFSSAKSKIVWP